MQCARGVLRPEDLRKHAEYLRKLLRKELGRQDKKQRSKRCRRPPRYRYSVRTDSGPIALRTFWSTYVKAMSFSGVGACRGCCSARSVAACAAHMARSPRRIRRGNGLAIPASSECPGSIEQRC
jgi:hypothetical protein